MYNDRLNEWEEAALLAKDIDNVKEATEIEIPSTLELPTGSEDCTAMPSQVVIALSASEKSLRNSTRGKDILTFLVESKRSFRILKPFATKPVFVSGVANNAKKRIACEIWHEYDEGVQTLSLPPCPCTRQQVEHDDRFVAESSYISKANADSFKKKGVCFTQSNIR